MRSTKADAMSITFGTTLIRVKVSYTLKPPISCQPNYAKQQALSMSRDRIMSCDWLFVTSIATHSAFKCDVNGYGNATTGREVWKQVSRATNAI